MPAARRPPFAPRALLPLLPLLLAHCAEPAAAVPPPRPPPPSPAPSPPPAAPASAPASEPGPPGAGEKAWPPLPPIETTELKDKLAFLSTLCSAAVAHDKVGGLHVGCRSCPPFETPDRKPDGHVAVDPDGFYALNLLLLGSFTKPGADEAAAMFDGCEPHSSNYGGALLAERRGGAWAEVRYDSGVHPDACQTYRRKDGRDIAVCVWGDGHQSRWHEMVFSYDFARSTPDRISDGWEEIVTMNDDAAASCFEPAPGAPVVSGHVKDLKLKDVNRDGERDLVVTVSMAKALPSKAYRDKCAELIAEMDKVDSKPVDVAAALGKPKVYELEFVYDGEKFKPTPQTARRLSQL